jgi:hypothetical protein
VLSISGGMFSGTAQKNGIAICARKSGATFVKRTVSLLPDTLTPEAVVRLPESTACAPTTSARNGAAYDCSFLVRLRLIACAKLAAVTGLPSENR